MVENSAGGYSFGVDCWKRLDRFLVLGADAPTYYIGKQELVKENARAVMDCIKEDGVRTVRRIAAISSEGRAPKNDPALFALAMCFGYGDIPTKREAAQAFNRVVRIGTHLFTINEYRKAFGGWGKTWKLGKSNGVNLTERF